VGDLITLSHESLSFTHQVQELAIGDVNLDANTVSGTAVFDPEQYMLHTWLHGVDGSYMQLSTDGGNWLANFGAQGIDLQPGMGGRAELVDQNSNATAVEWYAPNPRITVYPDAQWVDGVEWPDGSTVTISVQDQPACTMTMEPSGGEFFGGFPQDCFVAAGNVINLTNGTHTVEYTVRNLAITKIDKDANTVMGIADTDAVVHVWIWDMDGTDIEVTATNGEWVADFGASGIDLDMNMGFQAEIRDENGNGTSVDHGTYTRIVASITENWFYVIDFDPLSTLSYSIYDAEGGTLVANGTFSSDVNGYGGLDFEDHGWDLEPGNHLVITDGTTQKELTIEGFTFDTFDLTNGQLSGTAPGGEGREVWAGVGFPDQPAWMMTVGVNEAGAWFVDFGAPVPGNYKWVAAEIFDADGDASELRPASQIVFLRPSCGSTYTVEAGSLVEIRYGSWIAIGEELALQNAEHLTVDLVLNGETLIGTQQPVVPRSEIPCGSPSDNAYGVFYVTQLGPLSPGTYVAKVTWILDEPVTDGYDADGDGEPDWYGPGEVFTHEFTINVQ
jgi:hypothetical protein